MSPLFSRFLVFVAAASVLVLEIMAGRLMAPFVGVTVSDPDADSTDNDDNGIDPAALGDYANNGVSSGVVTLALSDGATHIHLT